MNNYLLFVNSEIDFHLPWLPWTAPLIRLSKPHFITFLRILRIERNQVQYFFSQHSGGRLDSIWHHHTSNAWFLKTCTGWPKIKEKLKIIFPLATASKWIGGLAKRITKTILLFTDSASSGYINISAIHCVVGKVIVLHVHISTKHSLNVHDMSIERD